MCCYVLARMESRDLHGVVAIRLDLQPPVPPPLGVGGSLILLSQSLCESSTGLHPISTRDSASKANVVGLPFIWLETQTNKGIGSSCSCLETSAERCHTHPHAHTVCVSPVCFETYIQFCPTFPTDFWLECALGSRLCLSHAPLFPQWTK